MGKFVGKSSAGSSGFQRIESFPRIRSGIEADDGGRTRDLRLGKPTLYQLSYVRADAILERLQSAQRKNASFGASLRL
jgi:hypothetical protein